MTATTGIFRVRYDQKLSPCQNISTPSLYIDGKADLQYSFVGSSNGTARYISLFESEADGSFIGDYCDVYLTHDSRTVRRDHNAGRNHLRNVLEYYQRMAHRPSPCHLRSDSLTDGVEISQEKAQSVIDSITSSYAAEGQPNPMFQGGVVPGYPPPPPPFAFQGLSLKPARHM